MWTAWPPSTLPLTPCAGADRGRGAACTADRPLLTLFDKQIQVRMGQCNVRRWTDDLLPLVEDDADPLGVMDLVTHRSGLDGAPALYEKFQKKEDGCIKVVLNPGE